MKLKQKFTLPNKIPINFEYEFSFLRDHSDISINPIKGMIPGHSSSEIFFEFSPNSPGTAYAEVVLQISQFDFEPFLIKIMGSGRGQESLKETLQRTKIGSVTKPRPKSERLTALHSETVNSKIAYAENENSEGNDGKQLSLKNYENTINSLANSAGVPLEVSKNPGAKSQNFRLKTLIQADKKSMKESKEGISNPAMSKGPQSVKTGLNLSTTRRKKELEGRKKLEKEFLDRFGEIEQVNKEKEFKFFVAIGDPDFTHGDVEALKERFQEYLDIKNNMILYESKKKSKSVIDIDVPIEENVVPCYQIDFDETKNDVFAVRRMILKKFMKFASMVVIQNRAGRRLAKIKELLSKAKTREDVKRLVEKDWQKAENRGFNEKTKIDFSFNFNQAVVESSRLPQQFDQKTDDMNLVFELTPTFGFDDFATIERLKPSDVDIMEYKNVDPLLLRPYPPIMSHIPYRTGSEEEYTFRTVTGKFEDYSKDILLFEGLPECATRRPLVSDMSTLGVDPSIREFQTLPKLTEIDPEFHLLPSQTTYPDALNPQQGFDPDLMKMDFLASTPGLESIRGLDFQALQENKYFYKKFVPPNGKNPRFPYDWSSIDHSGNSISEHEERGIEPLRHHGQDRERRPLGLR